MLDLYGVPVPGDDARRLVATFIVEGTPAALSAAAMIEKGVDRELYAVALTSDERNACLCALEEAPTVALGELRGGRSSVITTAAIRGKERVERAVI